MNIECVICTQLHSLLEDTVFTPCGHIFYFPCLARWLKGSKSCPQCQEEVSQSKTYKFFFNFATDNVIKEDGTTLQDKIESLKCKLLSKKKDVIDYVSKAGILNKQARTLQQAVMRLEVEIKSKHTINEILNDHLGLMKEDNKIVDLQRKEIETLQSQIDLNRNVQTLLNSSYKTVPKTIEETRDLKVLCTYIRVLQHQLSSTGNKLKEQQTVITNLYHDIISLGKEQSLINDEVLQAQYFEKELAISESKRLNLEKRLKAFEEKEQVFKKSDNSTSKIIISTEKVSPKKGTLHRLHECSDDFPIQKNIESTSKPHYFVSFPNVRIEDSSEEWAATKPTSKAEKNKKYAHYHRMKQIYAISPTASLCHLLFGKGSRPRKGVGPLKQNTVKAEMSKKAKLDDGNKNLTIF